MAVTKTLTLAVPYNLNSKVQQWDLGMTYDEGTEGESDYYESSFNVMVPATDSEGNVNFTPKAEGSWTLAQTDGFMPCVTVGHCICESVRQRNYQSP